MNQNFYYIIKEESNYNTMIDFLFKEANIIDFTELKHSEFIEFMTKNKVQKVMSRFVNPLLKKKFDIYNFFKQINSGERNNYIIFLNSSFINSKYPVSVLKSYKKKWPNMRFILLYIDIVSHPVSWQANKLRENDIFDMVYTVDEKDARKYSFNFIRTPYSTVDEYKNKKINKDLYFCGVTKDRGSTLLSLIDYASCNDVQIQMDVMCKETERNDFKKRKCVNLLDDYVAYDVLLEKTLNARCILDLVQNGQSALTLRPYEAVVYNRKLLTNSKSIFEFEFFDPRYMQYFEKVEDIDWGWVKEDIDIDYDYNGEFSPVYFLDDIYIRMNGEKL